MTHAAESNALDHVLQLLVDEGFDRMAHALELLLNEALKLERAALERSERVLKLAVAEMYVQGVWSPQSR